MQMANFLTGTVQIHKNKGAGILFFLFVVAGDSVPIGGSNTVAVKFHVCRENRCPVKFS